MTTPQSIHNAAVSLGKLGGAAGKGKSKVRGNKQYYIDIASKSAEVRRNNRDKRKEGKI